MQFSKYAFLKSGNVIAELSYNILIYISLLKNTVSVKATLKTTRDAKRIRRR